MSALSAENEADRIKEAVETIGQHLLTMDALVTISTVEVECGGRCKGALTITHSVGIDELVRRLAAEGWSVSATDVMYCPVCSGYNSQYWSDQT